MEEHERFGLYLGALGQSYPENPTAIAVAREVYSMFTEAALGEAQRQSEEAWAEFRELSVRGGTAVADLQNKLAASQTELSEARRQLDEANTIIADKDEQLRWTASHLAASQQREKELREALETIARNEDPDAHWSFEIASSALRALPEEKA